MGDGQLSNLHYSNVLFMYYMICFLKLQDVFMYIYIYMHVTLCFDIYYCYERKQHGKQNIIIHYIFSSSLDIVLKAEIRLHIIITRQIYNAGETHD